MPKVLNEDDIAAFRERFCDVAEGLFAEYGPQAVTVRQLADGLGVSAMTPYRYFADKDAMLAAVRARAFDRFAAQMEAAHALGEAGDPACAYIDFALAHPAAYKLMFDVNQPTFTRYPDLVRAMGRARLTMSYGVQGAASRGEFTGDVELFSHMIWASLHGAIMLQMAGLLHGDMDARAITRGTLTAFFKAV